MKTYAGIGSRQTPEDMLPLIQWVAVALRYEGWTLRSGHAPGADQAFEAGAGPHAEIFLPWPGFEKAVPLATEHVYDMPTVEAMELAAQHHPNWKVLTPGGQSLHARNVHQVLGRDCDSPTGFVVCWTQGGRGGGGTGQALRVADAYGIPHFDLADAGVRERLERYETAVNGVF